ncbi:MAG: ATP-binding protein [Spirochaetaceae bacterium]|nr:MAG: ATP-binding protein [Spirochaetaceae bacterium]
MSETRRVTIVTGHYGSGKSEFSINLALLRAGGQEGEQAASRGAPHPVALADVDVVNPYFRSREQRSLLESRGIKVVGNQLNIDQGVDLPAISPEVFGLVRNRETRTILDAGGDPVGARFLGSMRRVLDPLETEVLCVINGSRPETAQVHQAIAMIRSIEAAAGLAVTGLVNNTHMLEHTVLGHLLEGEKLCEGISRETGIPLRYVGVPLWLCDAVRGGGADGGGANGGGPDGSAPDDGDNGTVTLRGQIVPVAMYLRESWMNTPAALEEE